MSKIIEIVISFVGGGAFASLLTSAMTRKKINAEATSITLSSLLEVNAGLSGRIAVLEQRVSHVEEENVKLKDECVRLKDENLELKKQLKS